MTCPFCKAGIHIDGNQSIITCPVCSIEFSPRKHGHLTREEERWDSSFLDEGENEKEQ